jgi:hypothetical protein
VPNGTAFICSAHQGTLMEEEKPGLFVLPWSDGCYPWPTAPRRRAPSCWQATHVPLMREARVAASGAERM